MTDTIAGATVVGFNPIVLQGPPGVPGLPGGVTTVDGNGGVIDLTTKYAPIAEPVGAAAAATAATAATNASTALAMTGLPSYVGSRSKPFDPNFSLYNGRADTLRKIRAFVAQTRAGGSCRIGFIGDSTTAGSGATGTTTFSTQFRARLATTGCTVGGTGFQFAGQGITDTRWSKSGTVSDGGSYSHLSAAATKTFASDIAGTNCDLYFFANSGNFTITVDGGTVAGGQVTVTNGSYTTGTVTPSGSSVVGKVAITGLSAATHTVVVTAVGSVFYIGLDIYGTGLRVHNFGVASTKSADWTGTGFLSNFQMASATAAVDAYVIALGINDSAGAVSTTTYAGNMATLIANATAVAPVLLLAQHNSSGISATVHQPYVSKLYDAADTSDIPVVDILHRWGSYFNANLLGLTADSIHPNAFGYADWAAALSAVIAP